MSAAATRYEDVFRQFVLDGAAQIRPRVRRSRVEFFEDELVVPDGPFKGEPFRFRRQPCMRRFVAELDSGEWRESILVAPAQSGKTLVGYIGEVAYGLFELEETVVLGVPDWQMSNDKWNDLKGPILQTRFAKLVPSTGPGSRGGHVGQRTPAIRFLNSATLRFMSAGGSDASKSGFTAPTVLVTEADKLGDPRSTSDEGSPLEQMRARTMAYGDDARLGLETTVTVEHRPGWRLYQEGTASRLHMPCPHCHTHVALDRDDLTGWQGASDEIEAEERAAWSCSSCGEPWTERQRREAAQESVLVHRGQTVDGAGVVVGDPPRTRRLGFRVAAVDNLFTPASKIGAAEWKLKRLRDAGDDAEASKAERAVCQFVHCLPSEDPDVENETIRPDDVAQRRAKPARGVVPADVWRLAVGVDIGKYALHWTATAVLRDGSAHVVAYGRPDVPFDPARPLGGAIRAAMLTLYEELQSFPLEGGEAGYAPDVWAVDCGAYTDDVHAAVWSCAQQTAKTEGAAAAKRWYTITGLGETQYVEPRRGARGVGRIRHGRVDPGRAGRRPTISANVDAWSDDLQAGLVMPMPDAAAPRPSGLITLHDGGDLDHVTFARHIAAEERLTEWREKKGVVTRWVQRRKQNHYRDALKYSLIACVVGGAVFGDEPGAETKPTATPKTVRRGVIRPDGRPYMPTRRT